MAAGDQSTCAGNTGTKGEQYFLLQKIESKGTLLAHVLS
jgi:hypothetical protein